MIGVTNRDIDLWDSLQTQGIVKALEQYFQQTHGIQLLLLPFMVLLIITILGSLVGVIFLAKSKQWFELFILLLPVLYLISLSGPSSYSRFRVPLMPFIAILSGVGMLNSWDFLRWKKFNYRPPIQNNTENPWFTFFFSR